MSWYLQMNFALPNVIQMFPEVLFYKVLTIYQYSFYRTKSFVKFLFEKDKNQSLTPPWMIGK